MFNKLYYIRKIDEIIEGGVSRDIAFYNYIKNKKKVKVKFLENKNKIKQVIQTFTEIIFLLNLKDKEIFLHQNSINILFPIKLFSNNYIARVVHTIITQISKRNKIYLEINDLIYEQSIDLELLNDSQRQSALKMQKILFSIKNIKYIFASEEMKKYTVKEYKVQQENTYTCINGSIKLERRERVKVLEKEKKMKCVYAGTLNKGRQIEELIDIFENKVQKFKLILIGINGEWILEKEYKNIIYLGSYSEKEALNIVANCDIGLVPYNHNRFYYNLCYPTKNSFYISAGIPLLITPLKESLNQLLKYDILFVENLDKWANLLNNLSENKIKSKKEKIKKIKERYLWTNLINEVFKNISEKNH